MCHCVCWAIKTQGQRPICPATLHWQEMTFSCAAYSRQATQLDVNEVYLLPGDGWQAERMADDWIRGLLITDSRMCRLRSPQLWTPPSLLVSSLTTLIKTPLMSQKNLFDQLTGMMQSLCYNQPPTLSTHRYWACHCLAVCKHYCQVTYCYDWVMVRNLFSMLKIVLSGSHQCGE